MEIIVHPKLHGTLEINRPESQQRTLTNYSSRKKTKEVPIDIDLDNKSENLQEEDLPINYELLPTAHKIKNPKKCKDRRQPPLVKDTIEITCQTYTF